MSHIGPRRFEDLVFVSASTKRKTKARRKIRAGLCRVRLADSEKPIAVVPVVVKAAYLERGENSRLPACCCTPCSRLSGLAQMINSTSGLRRSELTQAPSRERPLTRKAV